MGVVGRRVEVHPRRLADAHAPDLALRHERAQVDLAEVHERDDGRAGHDHFPRLRRARGDGARERRDDREVAPVGPRFLELGARPLGVRLQGGDVGLGLEDLSLDRRHLRGADRRVGEVGAGGHDGAARGLDLAPGRRDDRRLALLGALLQLGLHHRDEAHLGEPRECVALPLRLRVRRLGLRELGLGGGEARLGLVDAALGVGARLIHAELALEKLLVEHGDLVLGDPEPRLGLANGGLGLLLAGADLRVVEHGDDLSGRDLVALPHGDLADPPGRLGPDRGVVPLDSSAHGNHAGRHGGPGQEEAPPGHRHQGQDEERSGEDDRPAPAASRRGRDRRRRGFGRGHARRVLGSVGARAPGASDSACRSARPPPRWWRARA